MDEFQLSIFFYLRASSGWNLPFVGIVVWHYHRSMKMIYLVYSAFLLEELEPVLCNRHNERWSLPLFPQKVWILRFSIPDLRPKTKIRMQTTGFFSKGSSMKEKMPAICEWNTGNGVPSSQPLRLLQDLAVQEKLPPLFLQGGNACGLWCGWGRGQSGFFGFVADFQPGLRIHVQNIPVRMSFCIRRFRRHSLFNILHMDGVYWYAQMTSCFDPNRSHEGR